MGAQEVMSDDLIKDLAEAAGACERIAAELLEGDAHEVRLSIEEAANQIGRAWGGSWLGYQSNVYTKGMKPKNPGDHFDSLAGDSHWNETRGDWAIYDPDAVEDLVLKRAGVTREEFHEFLKMCRDKARDFDRLRDEALSTIDALLSIRHDAVLETKRDEIKKEIECISPEEYATRLRPSTIRTRDQRALSGGIVVPPHISVEAKAVAAVSRGFGFRGLAGHLRYIERYLRKRRGIVETDKRGDRIFIGHGGSTVWKDLKDFLQDRLRLKWEEFNRESTAGLSTKERLLAMLDGAKFAFLVMTAEDDLAGGGKQARANVIHEAGLFQGRLGFEKAIILLEEGCDEFSNIVGTTQIRFPAGNVGAVFEEIRRVLEREGVI